MRFFYLPVIFLLLVVDAIQISFSDYPPCAQPALYALMPRGCALASTSKALNGCLCYDPDFLSAVAHRVYDKCGEEVLRGTAWSANGACQNTGTPIDGGAEWMITQGLRVEREGGQERRGKSSAIMNVESQDEERGTGFKTWVNDVQHATLLLGQVAGCLVLRIVGFNKCEWI